MPRLLWHELNRHKATQGYVTPQLSNAKAKQIVISKTNRRKTVTSHETFKDQNPHLDADC